MAERQRQQLKRRDSVLMLSLVSPNNAVKYTGGSTHFQEGETEAHKLGLGLDDGAICLSSHPALSE